MYRREVHTIDRLFDTATFLIFTIWVPIVGSIWFLKFLEAIS